MPKICSSAIRRRTPTSIRADREAAARDLVGGLNQVVTLASPGVVADSNGFFHPVGDHAQTQFSIDNQPVTDQQSRVYSNQISPDAVQSMEVITGVAPAEYGDKSSLVVHIVTKSGLDQAKPTGSASFGYGSFKSPTGDVNIGGGSHTVGQLLCRSAACGPIASSIRRSSRRCTTRATPSSFFDRLDAHAGATDTFHLNVQAARSAFDVPNTFDQNDAGQAQHQDDHDVQRRAWLLAGDRLEHAVHRERLRPPGPPDLLAQRRSVCRSRRPPCRRTGTLTNIGVKADVRYTRAHHNVKVGGTFSATQAARALHARLSPIPTFNVRRRATALQPGAGALRSDARRLAARLRAVAHHQAAGGVRAGRHQGGQRHVQARAPARSLRRPEPGDARCSRASASRTPCRQRHGAPRVVRAHAGDAVQREPAAVERRRAERRSSATARPLQPGKRNQVEVGIQQGFGRGSSPTSATSTSTRTTATTSACCSTRRSCFPSSWDHSTIDGFTGRVNLVEHARLQRVRRHGAHQRDLLAARRRRHPARGAGQATSGSITIRSSTRRPTCSTCSTRRTAPGPRSAGGTTRGWSPAPSAASTTRSR